MLSSQQSIWGQLDVDLFTDAKSRHLGNSQCARYHSITDDAFGYPCVGASFYGNHVYSVEFISKVLQNAISDISKGPTTMSFMFVLPDWKNAQWYSLLEQFDVVKQYPTRSNIFMRPSSSTYYAGDLRPAGRNRGKDRAFVQGNPWHVVVVVKNMFTKPKLHQVQLLHARLGHLAPSTLRSVCSSGINTSTTAKLADAGSHLP